MARIKQANTGKLSTKNQNIETIRVVRTLPLKSKKHSKCYDLSSKAQLKIVDGDLKKQEVALTELRKEMAEIIRNISVAEEVVRVTKAEKAKQGKQKKRILECI